MKRIAIVLLLLFAFTQISHAGTITYTTLSGDAGLSYSWLNDSFSTIYDEYNGSTDSDNIEADSLKEENFADEINPRIRTDENIGDYTYTGMLPATDTDLTSNISAGTSYVNGFRIVTAATAKTYTASKDTWVYIDQNGAFQYVEVALDGAQPTTPTNSLLLATVTTDGSAITAVEDLRQLTPPNLRIYLDLKNGCVISRDIETATKVNIGRGEIEFGSSVTSGLRRNTSQTTIDFTTNGRGGLDTGSIAEGYYFIFGVADDNTSTAYEGIASTSSTDATGVTGERLVGWCYAPSAAAISPDSCSGFRGVGGDAPNIVERKFDDLVTTTSTTVVPLIASKFHCSGERFIEVVGITSVSRSDAGGDIRTVISIDSAAVPTSEAFATCETAGSGGKRLTIVSRYYGRIAAGTHDIELKWATSANTGYASARSLLIEEK